MSTIQPIYDASIYHAGKWSPTPIIEAAPVQGELWPILGAGVLVTALILLFDSGGENGNGKPYSPPPEVVPLGSSLWAMLTAILAFIFMNRRKVK